MARGPLGSGRGSAAAFPWLLALLFLVGFNLRASILGVPPVLISVRTGLHLSYAEVGLLGGIPLIAFGAVAIPSSLLVRRRGGWWIVSVGLLLAAVGELARVLPLQPASLYLGTAILGVGIALTQPGLPALIQRWFAGRVQRGSVTLTLGITVGELVAAGITQPVLYRAFHSWQATMVTWGLLGLVCALTWLLAAPRLAAGQASSSELRFRPLLGSWRLWSIYVGFGGQSLVFFSANTWIPTSAPGGPHGAAATLSLTMLNGVMVPVDLLLIFWRRQFATRTWFYLGSSAVALAGCGGWLLFSDRAPLLFAALIGIGVALTFAGLLAYPPLVAAPDQVAPLSAVMLAVGYGAAFLGPFLGGLALDAGGGPSSPFLPITVAAAIMVVAALGLPSRLPASLARASEAPERVAAG